MPQIIVPESYYREVRVEVQNWVDACLGTHLTYDDSLQPSIAQWGLPWFRAGVLVLDQSGKILLMHENRVQVRHVRDPELKQKHLASGLRPYSWVDGDGGWNLPAGRLRVGENFEGGALHKTKAETGWVVAIERFLYARHSENPDNQYILPVYWAFGIFGPSHYATTGTSEIGWFTPEEIYDMAANSQLRSPDFVLESLKAYQDNPSVY